MAGSCGIPATATAVSVNLTVVGASEGGEMTAMPATAVAVPESTVISYPGGVTRSPSWGARRARPSSEAMTLSCDGRGKC